MLKIIIAAAAAFCLCLSAAFAADKPMPLSAFNQTLPADGTVRFNDDSAIAIKKLVRNFNSSNTAPVILFGEKDGLPFIMQLQPSDSRYKISLFQSGHYGQYDNLGESFYGNGRCSHKAQFNVASAQNTTMHVESFAISAPLSCLLATDKGTVIKIEVAAHS